jgi:hypothetical protein
LSHEAATVVSEEISNNAVSDECKILVLSRVFSIFLEVVGEKAKATNMLSYKLLLPLAVQGLQSCTRLEQRIDVEASLDKKSKEKMLKDYLWENVCDGLSRMLKPVPNESNAWTIIQRAGDLADLVNNATAHVPPRHQRQYCAILSFGASTCLEVAAAKAKKDNTTVKEVSNDGKKTGPDEDTLKLFRSCFAGVCSLQPEDQSLHATANQVLSECLDVLAAAAAAPDTCIESTVSVQATLLICQAMHQTQNQGIEPLTIAVFPHLCKLVGAEQLVLRQAAGGVLATINVGKVLKDTRTRCDQAEERADIAEQRAAKLATAIEVLQVKNESLERKFDAISAGSTIG